MQHVADNRDSRRTKSTHMAPWLRTGMPKGLIAGGSKRARRTAEEKEKGGKEAGEAEEKQTKKKTKEEKQRKENAPGVSDQRKEGKGATKDEDAVLEDLLELHESGFKVSWPSGPGPATARDAEAGEAEEKQRKKKRKEERQRKEDAPAPSAQREEGKGATEDDITVLQNLLELHESGFKVSWPSGLGPATARDAVAAARGRENK